MAVVSDPDRRLRGTAVIGGRLVGTVVGIRDGHIVSLEADDPRPAADRVGDDLVIAPGFIDVHVHGGVGVDVTEGPAAIARLAAALATRGVTSFVPTAVSAPLAELAAFAAAVSTARLAAEASDAGGPGTRRPVRRRATANAGPSARILGANLEGPAIDPAHRGAHDPAAIVDPAVLAVAWRERPGDWSEVRAVTLAPERPGGLDLVRLLAGRRVVASIGHTGATFAEAEAAYRAGATSTTHLFNAMSGLDHRAPGTAAAALADGRAFAELIADGSHVDRALWPLLWRILGPRLLLVSDGIAAVGVGDGSFRLGGGTITVRGGRATRPDGTLAGSTITVADAVANLVAAGLTLPRAVAAATLAPARLLRRRGLGRIAVGAAADLVLLDAAGLVRRTMIGGAWLDETA
jgi:N-acetylglucosamine-6-phosphate deacetylase